MDAFITRRGGAGGRLNFRVVGGTAQPENPKENTIWINTDQEITGLIMDSAEPTSADEGTVYIATGTKSNVILSVVKKTEIYVRPYHCVQYVSGEWLTKELLIYIDGQWTDLTAYLYNAGDTCNGVTGGWQARAMYVRSTGNAAEKPDFMLKEDHIYCFLDWSYVNGNGGVIETVNAIDLTPYDTLVFDIDYYYKNRESAWNFIGVYPESATVFVSHSAVSMEFPRSTLSLSGEYALDISQLSGKYKVGLAMYNANGASTTATIHIGRVYLK